VRRKPKRKQWRGGLKEILVVEKECNMNTEMGRILTDAFLLPESVLAGYSGRKCDEGIYEFDD
jgi:hypothetical protein